jgi:hypothetical protein
VRGAQADARCPIQANVSLTVRAMSEAERLLQTILEAGDIVGRDAAGRMVIQIAVERADFERLMAFGAADLSRGGSDNEP